MQLKPQGTYDILPPDTGKWQYIENILKETAETFGYREIRTPILSIRNYLSVGWEQYRYRY